jgi:hypothetical protein
MGCQSKSGNDQLMSGPAVALRGSLRSHLRVTEVLSPSPPRCASTARCRTSPNRCVVLDQPVGDLHRFDEIDLIAAGRGRSNPQLAATVVILILRCERSEPRRMPASAPRPHPSRAASRPPQDEVQSSLTCLAGPRSPFAGTYVRQ